MRSWLIRRFWLLAQTFPFQEFLLYLSLKTTPLRLGDKNKCFIPICPSCKPTSLFHGYLTVMGNYETTSQFFPQFPLVLSQNKIGNRPNFHNLSQLLATIFLLLLCSFKYSKLNKPENLHVSIQFHCNFYSKLLPASNKYYFYYY